MGEENAVHAVLFVWRSTRNRFFAKPCAAPPNSSNFPNGAKSLVKRVMTHPQHTRRAHARETRHQLRGTLIIAAETPRLLFLVLFALAHARRAMKPSVIWLHGLGDTGAGWRGAFGPLTKMCNWLHPDAPVQAVTSPVHQGEKMTSWFDIKTWPLGTAEPENPTGTAETVARIHKMLEDEEAKGIPSNRIVLGGFSQGGSVAILAGLSYPRKLGGIVAISGWGLYRDSLPSKVHEANKDTPMHYSVGMGDPIVTFPLTKQSGEVLQSILKGSINVMHVERSMHPPDQMELMAAARFIASTLELDA